MPHEDFVPEAMESLIQLEMPARMGIDAAERTGFRMDVIAGFIRIVYLHFPHGQIQPSFAVQVIVVILRHLGDREGLFSVDRSNGFADLILCQTERANGTSRSIDAYRAFFLQFTLIFYTTKYINIKRQIKN